MFSSQVFIVVKALTKRNIFNLLRKEIFSTYCVKKTKLIKLIFTKSGSHGIAPTRNCTHFLKIVFVVAGGGFYYYLIHQGNRSDKERKLVRKKFYAYKRI